MDPLFDLSDVDLDLAALEEIEREIKLYESTTRNGPESIVNEKHHISPIPQKILIESKYIF